MCACILRVPGGVSISKIKSSAGGYSWAREFNVAF